MHVNGNRVINDISLAKKRSHINVDITNAKITLLVFLKMYIIFFDSTWKKCESFKHSITTRILYNAPSVLKSKYDIYSLSIGTNNMVINVIAKITAVIGFSFISSFILNVKYLYLEFKIDLYV